MNPYDFVPLDMTHLPERRKPVWHNALAPNPNHPAKLYSGHLNIYMRAETPLFIPFTGPAEQGLDARSLMQNPDQPAEHIHRNDGKYIIPGTSIKGLLRSVVETLCNGCLSVFRIPREYTHNPVPTEFAMCQNNNSLCIACRLFGMMQAGRPRPGQRNIDVFLGKVDIGDAVVDQDSLRFYDPIYTAVLDSPKPRHTAFYLDANRRIAGRKFYFHHAGEPRTERRLIEIPRKPGEYRNQHIEPLDIDTEFFGRIDFSNLEADEFAALLLAITLQPSMHHKIGFGKPIGLGSVRMDVIELNLVDYKTRYTTERATGGIKKYNFDRTTALVNEQMASFEDPDVSKFWRTFSSQQSLQHLARIWQWPPDETVEYAYPSQQWFKSHAQARIGDTRNLYPGD